jgi:hypothetical protein
MMRGEDQTEEVNTGCNVSPSPTDVSPTENSWMLHGGYNEGRMSGRGRQS